jgi:hypothetical protein
VALIGGIVAARVSKADNVVVARVYRDVPMGACGRDMGREADFTY